MRAETELTDSTDTFHCSACAREKPSAERAQAPAKPPICNDCQHTKNLQQMNKEHGILICPACGAHYDSHHDPEPTLCSVGHKRETR